MTHHGPSQVGFSCPLRSRSPCGARSLPSIPPCSVLSASLRSALRLPFGLPSLPPCGARLRFGGLLSPNWRQIALHVTRGQWGFAKSRCSPHLSALHPQVAPPPSPVLPHGDARRRGRLRTATVGLAAALVTLVLSVAGIGRPRRPQQRGARGQRRRRSRPRVPLHRRARRRRRRRLRSDYRRPTSNRRPCRTRRRPASRSTRAPTSPIRSSSNREGRYYLFTSQDKVPQNVPVRSGTEVGQWGGPSDALPDPPAWAAPGVMWAPDVAQFGGHYLLYFTSQLRGVSPGTMCIGDAISTAVAGPYICIAGAVHLPAVARRVHRPPRVRRRHRPALHDLEVGPERPVQLCQHPDLQPSIERGRPPPLGAADCDLRPGRILAGPHRRSPAARAGPRQLLPLLLRRVVQPARLLRSARPAVPARWGRARTPPPHRCWARTPRARGRARNRSSPTRRGSGSSTRPSAPPCRCPGRPARWPWPTWASARPAPTWRRRSRSPGRAESGP